MSLPRRSFARTVTVFAMAAAVFTISAHAQQPGQPPPAGPVYVVTHVDIIGGQQGVAEAIKLMHDFQVDSLKDPGAVRFEVMEQDNRLNHFAMVEVWQSRDVYEAHQSHEHSRSFREKVGPMLGSPFDVRVHRLMP